MSGAAEAVAVSAFADRVGVRTCHHQANTLITELGQDSAHARTMFLVTQQRAGEATPRMILCGVYEDDFVRRETGWHFAKRVAYTGGSSG